jgi:hypothetical protein
MPGVTMAVDETSPSATQMLQVSRDLSCQAEQLRHTVENFLRQVAAADALKRTGASGPLDRRSFANGRVHARPFLCRMQCATR